MTRNEIHEFVHEVFGHNHPTEDVNGWVSLRCPYAPWLHKHGDKRPSAGISVADGGTSIFNCFAAGTKVITYQGTKEIQSLKGWHEVLAPDGSWTPARFSSYGRQRIWKLSLSRNGVTKEIRTTENHRWFSYHKGGAYRGEVYTDQLKIGEVLEFSLPKPLGAYEIDSEGLTHGVIFGDGTKQKGTKWGSVCLYGEKQQIATLLVEGKITEYENYTRVHGPYAQYKKLPTLKNTNSYIVGFIAGLIATDGHVAESKVVSISSASREVMETLRDLCVRVGIATYGVRTATRLGYGKTLSCIHSLTFIASTLPECIFIREDQRKKFAEGSRKYDRVRWSVVGVEKTEDWEEVYCATVPGYAAFTLEDNILTGNCFSCHKKGPLSWLLEDLEQYTGEDWTMLADSIRTGEYLGGTVPQWGESTHAPEDALPEPLDEEIIFGLYDSAKGHKYLRQRGISDSAVDDMQLMLDPADSSGVERILFPVYSRDGKLYGVSGRATTKRAALKVRDYHGLPKRLLLLGAHLIKDSDPYIILVEGLFDYARFVEYGMPVCAIMSSTLTPAQAEIVKDIGKPVYFFHDDDKAGRDARDRAADALAPYLPFNAVSYPRERTIRCKETGEMRAPEDPAELSLEQVQSMLEGAEPMI